MSKQIYIALIWLLPICCSLSAQDNSANYVTTNNVIAVGDTLTTIEYFDGLGRGSEVVQKGYSANGSKDLVSLTEYDGMGRKYKSWLPTPVASTGNSIETDAFSELAKTAYSDQVPYYKYEYRNTLDNPVVKEWGPGRSWTLLGKAKVAQYEGVSEFVCPRLSLSSDKKSFTYGVFYKAGSIKVVTQKDEDKVSVSKYYDQAGRLIMEVSGGNATTYNLYDNDGNLIFVLPPAAYDACTKKLNTSYGIDTDENLKKYAYFYRYDGKGRCVEKKLPGCEPIKMIYDKENKMIFKQDGNLRKNNEWQFMLFDTYNRPTVMGVCKNADKIDIGNYDVTSRFSSSGKYAMYDANVDLNVSYLMKANYYDNYSFLGSQNGYDFQAQDGYDMDIAHAGGKTTTKGLLTGTRTYELNEDNRCYTEALYYNDKGEVVQRHRDNQVDGVDDFYYQLNPYTGKLCKEKQVHQVGMKVQKNHGNAIETIIRRYAYDSMGRLDSVKFKWNNTAEFLVKHYIYDDLGRVAQTRCSSSALLTNYNYNVRGQLLEADSRITKQTLYYNNRNPYGQVPYSYNGNVSAYEWKSKMGKKWVTEAYGYEYDKYNRLSSALSTSVDSLGNITQGNHDTHYEYDSMGNIIGITRKSVNLDDGEVGCRDDAVLEYEGNHLVHISNNGFVDSSRDTQILDREYNNVSEFAYDANGNMTRNLNKDIVKIVYNVLNLPDFIYMRNGDYIRNTYDGDGNKLSSENWICRYNITIPESGNIQGNLDSLVIKQVADINDSKKVYYYCGDFVYHTESVKTSNNSFGGASVGGNKGFLFNVDDEMGSVLVTDKIDFGEGYILPNKFTWVYNYVKDYLGNIRYVIYNKDILQTNNYYPFGGFYGDDSNKLQYRWRFGNKELGRKVDEYDFGARWYDPTMGRFCSMDKYAERYYGVTPYAFCMNNPINSTDPTGNYIIYISGEDHMTQYLYDNGFFYNFYRDKNKQPVKFGRPVTIYGTTMKAVANALESMSNSKIKEIRTVYNALVNSRSSHYIEPTNGKSYTHPENSSITYTYINLGRSSKGSDFRECGLTMRELLGHELKHAYDMQYHKNSSKKYRNTNINLIEFNTVYFENLIRSEEGNELRTHYTYPIDSPDIPVENKKVTIWE